MQETMEAAVTPDTIPEPAAADGAQAPPSPTTPEPETTSPSSAPAPTIPVRFRHQDRELSMEEATGYAQMGLKYESLQPTLDKLRMMAAGRGQSLEAFVGAWAEAEELAARQQLEEKTGGDGELADRLWQWEVSRRQKVCEAPQPPETNAEGALAQRMASEYKELREECPEVTDFDALPEGVLRDAADNGRHLLDAYLRHQWRENRRIEQNETAQRMAAQASAGQLGDAPAGDGKDAATTAMLKAIRSVFS